MGVRVYDKASQSEIEVSPQEAQEGWTSGNFDLLDKEINISRGGDFGTIGVDQLANAVGEGFSFSDAEEHRSLRIQQEEGGIAGAAIGTLESAASGLTFGLSRLAQEKAGMSVERMRAREEAAGALGTAAEVGAGLAGIGVTGGGGLLARGAVTAGRAAGIAGRQVTGRAIAGAAAREGANRFAKASMVGKAGQIATAPVRALSVGAEAAEMGLARGLGRMGAPAIVQKMVPVAGRGMVEGAAYGVGAEIDESVLGEREITADRLLAAGGMGALLGGAGEVGIGMGLPAIMSGAKNVSASSLNKIMNRATGAADGAANPIGEMIANATKKGMTFAGGAPAEAADTVVDLLRTGKGRKAFKDVVYDRTGARARVAGKTKGHIDSLMGHFRKVQSASDVNVKAKHIGDLIPEEISAASNHAAREHVGAFARQIDELVSENKLWDGQLHSVPLLKKAKGAVTRAFKEIGDDRTGAAAYRAVDQMKREMGFVYQKAKKFGLEDKAEATLEKLTEMADGLKTHLEDGNVWGVKAAKHQEELNTAISQTFRTADASEAYIKKVFKEGEMSETQALKLIRDAGKFKGKEDDIIGLMESAVNEAKTRNRLYDMPPEAHAATAAMEKELSAVKREIAGQKDMASAALSVDMLGKAEGRNAQMATVLGLSGAIGGPITGLAGGAVGYALGALTKPLTTAKTFAGVMDMVEKVGSKEAGALSKFLGKTVSGAAKAAKVAARATPMIAGKQAPKLLGKPESREERYERTTRMLAKVANDPDALSASMDAHISAVEGFAPGLGALMREKSGAAVEFLQSKLPPVYAPPFGDPIVDPVSLSKFLRYTDVVENPIVALDNLADRTITVEHAEALRAVYPAIFRGVQDQIFEHMGELQSRGEGMKFNDRIQLGILFDMPTDQALTPESYAMIQGAHGPAPMESPEAPGGAPAPKVRAAAGGKIKASQRAGTTMTDSERGLTERHG